MILTALFLFGGSISVDAQFGRLKRKIKDKLERKIDQKIDQEIDEIFEEEESKGDKKKKKYDLSKMGMQEMELTDVYEFDVQIDWLVTSDEGEEPIEMSQMMAAKNFYFGMTIKGGKGQTTQGTLIFDMQKEYMIIIPENEKQAMVTSMGSSETISNKEMEGEKSDGTITATGKKKKILGYTCKQYLFSSTEAEGEMWITEELDLPNFDLFTYLQKMAPKSSNQSYNAWEDMKDGFVLEMTTTNKEGNVSKIETIKVNQDANIKYDMNKYKAIDMTGMKNLMEK